MKDPKRVLFVNSEIYPYLPETEISIIGRYLPQGIQESGKEIRTFMPRYGCVNERRNQLHEVIRLSGMNMVIHDIDRPLVIKVASISSASRSCVMVCSFMVGFSFDEIRTRRNRINTTRFLDFGGLFSPAGKFCAWTSRPEPAPAGRMPCRLSCTASCIFPGRRCFSSQRVVLYFYLYPRSFAGGCAGNLRGVVKMGGTKRPVLTLGEHRRHSGHKTRNAIGR